MVHLFQGRTSRILILWGRKFTESRKRKEICSQNWNEKGLLLSKKGEWDLAGSVVWVGGQGLLGSCPGDHFSTELRGAEIQRGWRSVNFLTQHKEASRAAQPPGKYRRG